MTYPPRRVDRGNAPGRVPLLDVVSTFHPCETTSSFYPYAIWNVSTCARCLLTSARWGAQPYAELGTREGRLGIQRLLLWPQSPTFSRLVESSHLTKFAGR